MQQMCGLVRHRLFDLLYSGVTGPWQRQTQGRMRLETGLVHMVQAEREKGHLPNTEEQQYSLKTSANKVLRKY